jgi:DNA-directed RNA polymerase beta subunit
LVNDIGNKYPIEAGIKVGEMETVSITAHGAAFFMKEKLFHLSDYYSTTICSKCGIFTTLNPKQGRNNCSICGTNNIEVINIPYACKLLFQELMAMNIMPRLNIDKKAIK